LEVATGFGEGSERERKGWERMSQSAGSGRGEGNGWVNHGYQWLLHSANYDGLRGLAGAVAGRVGCSLILVPFSGRSAARDAPKARCRKLPGRLWRLYVWLVQVSDSLQTHSAVPWSLLIVLGSIDQGKATLDEDTSVRCGRWKSQNHHKTDQWGIAAQVVR
jgi:hypothetical protein